MRVLLGLLPVALGVAVIGAATLFLLDRNIGLGPWLLAALVFAHGWVHLVFMFPTPLGAEATAGGLAYPFDMGRSWLIVNVGIDAGLVRGLGVVLMFLVFAGFVLAALSTVGWLVPGDWWAGLVTGSAVGSTLLLAVFFSPALVLGCGINAALAWLVLASVWSPPTVP